MKVKKNPNKTWNPNKNTQVKAAYKPTTYRS